MRKYLIYLPVVVLLLACNDDISIEFPETKRLLVVEGWITDEPGPQEVRLSITNDYASPQLPPGVTDARVSVSDASGNIFLFEHASGGIYVSDSSSLGLTGNSYQLRIILSNGDTIRSSRVTMKPVHEIEILTFESYEEEPELVEDPETLLYFPVIFAEDPPETDDYYLWRIYRNDSLFAAPQDIVMLSDRFISGRYKNEFTEFEFLIGDTIKLEVSNLSLEAFDYVNLFKSQTTSLGTSTGTAPSSLEGNLLNITRPGQQVLGFFGARSVRQASTVVIP